MSIELAGEVEQLARLLALKTGKTPDAIIREAIEEHARASGIALAMPRKPFNEPALRAAIARISALPILDDRTPDEIIGYNEYGVPE